MKETFILNSRGVNRISDSSFDSYCSTSGFTGTSGSSARCSGISDSSSDSIFGRSKSRPRPAKMKKVKGQLRSSSNSSGVESDQSSSDWGPTRVGIGDQSADITYGGHLRSFESTEVNKQTNIATPTRTKEVKCCVVGDEGVGKTALIVSYLDNGYPETYTPTVHDCYTGKS